MSKKVHVKTGDTVVVINGKDRGKTGKVMQVSPSEGKVMLEPDAEAVEALGAELIADDISCVEEGRIRHDELKTAYMVFSYLMR